MPRDRDELLALAKMLEACAEDAKRPEPVPGYTDVVRNQPPAIISLANGLQHIAAALRAQASSETPT